MIFDGLRLLGGRLLYLEARFGVRPVQIDTRPLAWTLIPALGYFGRFESVQRQIPVEVSDNPPYAHVRRKQFGVTENPTLNGSVEHLKTTMVYLCLKSIQ